MAEQPPKIILSGEEHKPTPEELEKQLKELRDSVEGAQTGNTDPKKIVMASEMESLDKHRNATDEDKEIPKIITGTEEPSEEEKQKLKDGIIKTDKELGNTDPSKIVMATEMESLDKHKNPGKEKKAPAALKVAKDEKKNTTAAEAKQNPSEKKDATKDVKEGDKKGEKKKFKFDAAIIDAKQLAEAQARDVGDAKMTESKEDRSGNWLKRNITRPTVNVWKHNLFQEYFRQSKIADARKAIYESQNLYTGEDGVAATAHQEAMNAIVNRFMSEYKEDTLKESERESLDKASDQEKGALSHELKSLVQEYASNDQMDEGSFNEERKRILSEYGGDKHGRNFYADNIGDLLGIANEVRDAVKHGEKLNEMDIEINVTLGKARESLNSEAKMSSFEKMVEGVQNNKVGKLLLNPITGGILGAAAGYGIAKLFGKAGGSALGKAITFGVSGLGAGAFAAMSESARLERERNQDSRERAKGAIFDESMKRRQEFGGHTYERMPASDYLATMKSGLEKILAGERPDSETLKSLAQVEARTTLGDLKGIDLFTYNKGEVEVQRAELDLTRAMLKAELKKWHEENPQDAENPQDMLSLVTDSAKNHAEYLTTKEGGIDKQDEAFKKMKHTKVAWKFAQTAVLGAVGGALVQTGISLSEQGIASILPEGAVKNFAVNHLFHYNGRNVSALEGAYRHFFGGGPRVPTGIEHMTAIDGTEVRLPEGVDLQDNGNGTFDLLRDHDPIAKGLPIHFDDHGNMPKELQDVLKANNITWGKPDMIQGMPSTESTADYIRSHQGLTHTVHREFHYDNDTKPTDFNEGKLKWGGVGKVVSHDHFGHEVGTEGTGLDEHGNYVLDISEMTPKGSFHHGHSVDVIKAFNEGKLKMLFSASKGTQQHVFDAAQAGFKFVKVGDHIKVTIPKGNDIGKIMFAEKDHHAVFTGKYAEVVESDGFRPDGAENVKVLATAIGKGHDVITEPTVTPTIKLGIPDTWDYEVPYFMPTPRTPLERAEKFAEKKKAVSPEDAAAETEEKGEEKEFGELKAEGKEGDTVKKELKSISAEEYAALKEDLAFINKKVQAHEGIIVVKKSDLKSELARKRYDDLEHIADGKPVSFNKEELMTMGNELETNLSNSKVTTGGGSVLDKVLDLFGYQRTGKTVETPEGSVTPATIPHMLEDSPLGESGAEADPDAVPTASVAMSSSTKEALAQFDQKEKAAAIKTAPRPKAEGTPQPEAANGRTPEKVFEKFTTPDDIIAKDYLLQSDLINTFRDPWKDIEDAYENTHTPDGKLLPELQAEVESIKKIKESGKGAALENLTTTMLGYTKNTFTKLLGKKIENYKDSRTWAYAGIAKRQSDGDINPLNWNPKEFNESNIEVQNMVDWEIGEAMMTQTDLQQTVLNNLKDASEAAKKAARVAIELVTKGLKNKLSNQQLTTLGRNVRINQGVGPVAPIFDRASKEPVPASGDAAPVVPDAAPVPEPVVNASGIFEKPKNLLKEIKSLETKVAKNKASDEEKQNLELLKSPLMDKIVELSDRLGGDANLAEMLGGYGPGSAGSYDHLMLGESVGKWIINSKDQLGSIEEIVDKKLAELRTTA